MKSKLARLIGERLRQVRKEAGMTQEDLGERAGLHYTFVGHIERGTKLPSILTLFRLSEALKVPITCFLESF